MYTGKTIYTVSLLTREAKQLLEASYANIQVEGEISGLSRPASGHQYFNIKDNNAQLRCVFFKNNARLSPVKLADGMQVILSVRVSLYEQRGDFQLIVQGAVDAGEGLLRRKFEELKQQLASEGLFDQENKQPLPSLPVCVGIITSTTGAAIHDIISTFKRRYPATRLLIYPAQVQGKLATNSIVDAIQTANFRNECDVLIVARGGGSLEDLWSFNEERVARAIFCSSLPVVSAVGHESDITISDLVADARAATPTAAAEMLSPDLARLLRTSMDLQRRLKNSINRHLESSSQKLDFMQLQLGTFKQGLSRITTTYTDLSRRFVRLSSLLTKERTYQFTALTARIKQPGALLQQRLLFCRDLELRLDRATRNRISSASLSFTGQNRRLSHRLLERHIQQKYDRLRLADRHFFARIPHLLQQKRLELETRVAALQSLSPLHTLARGFAILQVSDEPEIVRSVNQINTGDRLQAKLRDGTLHCTVNKVQKNNDE